MNLQQVKDYVIGIGLDVTKWTGCNVCGSCQGKKIKCRNGKYEIHIYFSRGSFNLFKDGKAIKGGKVSEINTILADVQ